MNEPETLSYSRAAERLGCSRRTVERLVKRGRLDTFGAGQHRRVSIESIQRYINQRNRDKTGDKMSKPPTSTLLVSAVPAEYRTAMRRLSRSVPPLNPLEHAAKRLGISPEKLNAMIRGGSVPVIRVGNEVFVPQHWLVEMLARAHGMPIPTLGIFAGVR